MRDLATNILGGALVVGLLLLSGCDVARSARNDLAHLTGPDGPLGRSQSATASRPVAATTKGSDPKATNKAATTTAEPAKPDPPKETANAGPSNINLVGKSDSEVRALLGPPNSEEERAPGKTWHYRDGQCAVDVHLYPDVQTRQFGTLAYEVKSDDSTDEGKRNCLAHLRSRTATSVE
jgi:hypothetical protein